VRPFPQCQEVASDQHNGFCWSENEPSSSTASHKSFKLVTEILANLSFFLFFCVWYTSQWRREFLYHDASLHSTFCKTIEECNNCCLRKCYPATQVSQILKLYQKKNRYQSKIAVVREKCKKTMLCIGLILESWISPTCSSASQWYPELMGSSSIPAPSLINHHLDSDHPVRSSRLAASNFRHLVDSLRGKFSCTQQQALTPTQRPRIEKTNNVNFQPIGSRKWDTSVRHFISKRNLKR